MLLFGIYRLCDKQMVISNQICLINTFQRDIYKARDQLINMLLALKSIVS